MPIHDWSQVDAGLFHDFHQSWTVRTCNVLNHGVLPAGYFALVASPFRIQRGEELPEFDSLQRRPVDDGPKSNGGLAVMDAPPRARFVTSAEEDRYAAKANRIVIRHRLGQVVAVIEIVSSGNKSGSHALRTFVEKAADLLRQGINLLIVDLFPPSPRDPQGIHKAIWDEIAVEPFELPADKPLTVAAYSAGELKTAYVEPVAVGDDLPALPIFLDSRTYVPAPLEETYRTTWSECPDLLREIVPRA